MRILILTAWYAPFIHPRAHRWTSLAEQWVSEGHEVTVLTTRRRDCSNDDVIRGVRVIRQGFDSLKEVAYYLLQPKQARGRVGAGVPTPPGLFQRFMLLIYKAVWKKILFPDEAVVWHKPGSRALHQLLMAHRYDLLVSVSLPFSSHVMAMRTLERLLPENRPFWLADMGDPFALQRLALNNRLLYGKCNRALERRVLRKADCCIVATLQTKRRFEQYYGAQAVGKMSVIGPLLHPLPEFHPKSPEKEGKLVLAYFGALYKGMRTPFALLRLLELLQREVPNLECRFYGDIFPEFYADMNNVSCVRLMGLQSRESVREAMQEADILVNIGNMDNCQLPSKAPEYLAAAKPVLHLSYVDDDPFCAFFEVPGAAFKSLRVGANGLLAADAVIDCAAWIKKAPIVERNPQWVLKLTGYSINAVSAQYWSAIHTRMLD